METLKERAERIKNWIENGCNVEIESHRQGLGRAVVLVFNKQTADEKSTEDTKHNNGIGFNGVDAKILSSIAKQFISRNSMSIEQSRIVKKKMQKYAMQIAKIQIAKKERPSVSSCPR